VYVVYSRSVGVVSVRCVAAVALSGGSSSGNGNDNGYGACGRVLVGTYYV